VQEEWGLLMMGTRVPETCRAEQRRIKEFLKDFKIGASLWTLFTVVIVDARNHEPEIFLNIYLSNTESFWIIFSLRTHVSHPYTTVGLITVQYNFSLDLLDTSLLVKRALFA
jgi:hypothetical protein